MFGKPLRTPCEPLANRVRTAANRAQIIIANCANRVPIRHASRFAEAGHTADRATPSPTRSSAASREGARRPWQQLRTAAGTPGRQRRTGCSPAAAGYDPALVSDPAGNVMRAAPRAGGGVQAIHPSSSLCRLRARSDKCDLGKPVRHPRCHDHVRALARLEGTSVVGVLVPMLDRLTERRARLSRRAC